MHGTRRFFIVYPYGTHEAINCPAWVLLPLFEQFTAPLTNMHRVYEFQDFVLLSNLHL